MSETECDVDQEALEELPARTLAFDAVVRTAVEKAEETSRWRRRFDSGAVRVALESEVSDRTIRRAMKGAEALGWIEKPRSTAKEWEAGPRAEGISGAGDDEPGLEDVHAWTCSFCQNVILGETHPGKCPECRSDAEELAKRNVTVAGAGETGHI